MADELNKVIHRFIYIYRGVAWDFEAVRTRINFSLAPLALTTRGVWGHAPPENFEI